MKFLNKNQLKSCIRNPALKSGSMEENGRNISCIWEVINANVNSNFSGSSLGLATDPRHHKGTHKETLQGSRLFQKTFSQRKLHFQSARKLETLVAGSREAFGVHGLYHLSWWHLYIEAVLRWLIFLSISPSLGHLAHLVGVFSWTLEEILETTRVSAWSLVEKNRWVLPGWLVCLSLCVSFQNEIFEGEHRRRPSVNRNSFSHEKNFVFSLGLLAR